VKIKKNILVIAILLCALIGIKLLRLLPIPGISIFWNAHIYFFLIVGFIAFAHINKFFRNALDRMVATLILTIFVIVVFRHPDDVLINVATFILPIFSYYLFRNIGINYQDIYNLFYIISGFLIILFLIDFFSNNILNLNIFDYAKFQTISASEGRIVAVMGDIKIHPIFGESWLRVGGVTFSPQPTAVLYASFGIFHLYIYNKTKTYMQRNVFFMYLLILFLYNSGTSIVVLVLLSLIIKQRKHMFFILFTLFIPTVFVGIIALYGSVDMAIMTFAKIFEGVYNTYLVNIVSLDEFFLSSLLLGTGLNDSGNQLILNFEIDFLNLIFQLGIINIVVLISIFYQAKKYFFSLLEDNIDLLPFCYLALGIIIGSLHYQSIFKYPNSVLLFGIIGIVSRFHINNRVDKLER
jgi:hypothetical protein